MQLWLSTHGTGWTVLVRRVPQAQEHPPVFSTLDSSPQHVRRSRDGSRFPRHDSARHITLQLLLFLSLSWHALRWSMVPTPTFTSLLLGLSPTRLPPAPISHLTFRKNNHDSCFGLVLLPSRIPEDRFLSKPNPSLSTSPFSLSNLPFRDGMPPARSPLLSDRGSNLLPSPQRTPLLSPFFLCALRSDGEERTHQGRSLC